MIRLLLIDDHAAFCQSLAFTLEREPDITVVGQASTIAEARQHLPDFDVTIIDLTLPDGSGVGLIRELRAAHPHCAVLVLTASDDYSDRARAIDAGAMGLLHKSASLADIVDAIRHVATHQSLLSLEETIDLLRHAGQQRERDWEAQQRLERLTPRERDVLQALADGLPDKAIATRFNISAETVHTHMVNILSKLGAESRLQALVFAARHGAVKIV